MVQVAVESCEERDRACARSEALVVEVAQLQERLKAEYATKRTSHLLEALRSSLLQEVGRLHAVHEHHEGYVITQRLLRLLGAGETIIARSGGGALSTFISRPAGEECSRPQLGDTLCVVGAQSGKFICALLPEVLEQQLSRRAWVCPGLAQGGSDPEHALRAFRRLQGRAARFARVMTAEQALISESMPLLLVELKGAVSVVHEADCRVESRRSAVLRSSSGTSVAPNTPVLGTGCQYEACAALRQLSFGDPFNLCLVTTTLALYTPDGELVSPSGADGNMQPVVLQSCTWALPSGHADDAPHVLVEPVQPAALRSFLSACEPFDCSLHDDRPAWQEAESDVVRSEPSLGDTVAFTGQQPGRGVLVKLSRLELTARTFTSRNAS